MGLLAAAVHRLRLVVCYIEINVFSVNQTFHLQTIAEEIPALEVVVAETVHEAAEASVEDEMTTEVRLSFRLFLCSNVIFFYFQGSAVGVDVADLAIEIAAVILNVVTAGTGVADAGALVEVAADLIEAATGVASEAEADLAEIEAVAAVGQALGKMHSHA